MASPKPSTAPKKPLKKYSRPDATSFSKEVCDEICRRIANGEMLTRICADSHLPNRATVNAWLLDSREEFASFHADYSRAREIQADTIFDEILDIADDATRDWKTVGAAGREKEVPDTEVVQRSRLRVDTRLKIAALLNPRKYKTDWPVSKADDDPGSSGQKVTIKGGLPDTPPIKKAPDAIAKH